MVHPHCLTAKVKDHQTQPYQKDIINVHVY